MKNLAGLPTKEATLEAARELEAAGIPIVIVDPGRAEVQSLAGGSLLGWSFDRRWYYWAARSETPMPADVARRTWTSDGDCRADGDCGNPFPNDEVNVFHVDTALGLSLLVRAIREKP